MDSISIPLWQPKSVFLHQRMAFQLSIKHKRPQLRCRPKSPKVRIKSEYPQNEDFPQTYSTKEKKPFPTPVVEMRRAARERMKSRKGQPRAKLPPPRNGMVVRSLVPLAHDVYNARMALINSLKILLQIIPVHACSWCNEIHVGPEGHPFKSCKGKNATLRKGSHEWTSASLEDVLTPVDSYHLFDRLGKRIPHESRFSIPRVSSVVELCIQAGVDLPEYPTKRRRKPVIRVGKSEYIDADESDLPDAVEPVGAKPLLSEMIHNTSAAVPSEEEERRVVAEEALSAWEMMRKGCKKLMKAYPVRVCGYCPEVHVGSSGHKAQNCGAFKHQQRNGQHGWQSATIDDLIPPKYVWHLPNGLPLQRQLRSFYGQAPAVVEICVQAGAVLPEEYKPTMRLDVGIPSSVQESDMVV